MGWGADGAPVQRAGIGSGVVISSGVENDVR